MATLNTDSFLGLECVSLENEALSLLITRSVGPRLISLSLKGRENLFAEIPHFTIEGPGGRDLHLWGGHRMWYAPEVKDRTYLPDDAPVAIEALPGKRGVTVTQETEESSAMQKHLRVEFPDDGATLIVDHELINHGAEAVTYSPWAITQLKPGGLVIVPQMTESIDDDGLLANRSIALWRYTDITSPHIRLGNRFIMVRADMSDGALKFGIPNPLGWIAYAVDGMMFVKMAPFHAGAHYFDAGSSTECYVNDEFVELETLGPHEPIQPGERAAHRELWHVYDRVPPMDGDMSEDEIGAVIDDLDIPSLRRYLNHGNV